MKVFIIVNERPNQLSEIVFRYNKVTVSIVRAVIGAKFNCELKRWFVPKDQITDLISQFKKSNIDVITDLPPNDSPDTYKKKTITEIDTIKRKRSTSPKKSPSNSIIENETIIGRTSKEGHLYIDLPLPIHIYRYFKENIIGLIWGHNQWILKDDQIDIFHKICEDKDFKYKIY